MKILPQYRILVVGGCGFIGSHIVQSLQRLGHEIWTIDNINTYHNSLDINLLWKAVAERTQGFKKDNINKSITDNLSEEFEMIKPQIVINLAAYPSVKLVEQYKQDALQVMGAGLINLLELCKKYQVEKYIYFSSSMVYGNWTKSKMSEWDTTNPINLYGNLKLFGEKLNTLYDMHVYNIRPCAVYGPGDYSNRVLNQFCLNAQQDKPLIIHGKNTRIDFTYVADVVSAVEKMIDNTRFGWDNTFNITGGRARLLTDVAEKIEELSGKKLDIRIVENDKSQPKRGVFDLDKAFNILHWQPLTTLHFGLKSLYDWTYKFYQH